MENEVGITAQLRGGIVAFALFHSALVASSFVLLPSTALLFIPSSFARQAYRMICAQVQEAWFSFALALLRRGLGIELIFHLVHPASTSSTSESFNGLSAHRAFAFLEKQFAGRSMVLVANHRSRIDWMFLWGVCLAFGRLGGMKIVLKDSLKQMPGFGWAMQCFGFIFLTRQNRHFDLKTLADSVAFFCSEPGKNATIVLFPEGTDLSGENLLLSRKFAKEQGLQVYNEVLHPKTAGFCTTLQAAGSSSVLLDATIGYVECVPGLRPNEKDLFTGRPPRQVHIRLEVVDFTAPGEGKGYGSSAEALASLCRARFLAKEQRLARFSAPVHAGLAGSAAATASLSPDIAALSEDCEVLRLDQAPGAGSRMVIGTLGFAILEFGCLLTAVRRGRALGLTLAAAAVAYTMAAKFGGIDSFQRWHGRRFLASRSHTDD